VSQPGDGSDHVCDYLKVFIVFNLGISAVCCLSIFRSHYTILLDITSVAASVQKVIPQCTSTAYSPSSSGSSVRKQALCWNRITMQPMKENGAGKEY